MKLISKLFVLIVLVLAACSPAYVVNSDSDRKVNLRNFQTYQIIDSTNKPKDPIMDNQFNRERTETAIHYEMKKRNLEAVEENPDLKVMFYTDRRERQESQYANNPSPWGWPRANNSYVRSYTENTLIVELIDANTNKLVWQGWASGEMNRDMKNPEKVISEKVTQIFSKYPVRPAGQSNDQLYNNPSAGLR